MKKFLFVMCITLLALGSLSAFAQESVEFVAADNLWLVELKAAPVADGGRATTVASEQAAFKRSAAAARVQYKERFAYSKLFNGFAVQADASQVAKIRALGSVKQVWPVEEMTLPEPVSEIGPDMAYAIAMTGADVAKNSLGLTGAGIKVGIIDSGIDMNHPDFGGNGTTVIGTHPRIAYGYDFVGDAYNASGSGAALTPVPDDNPDDCGGHGTHVAGIVGANGNVKGVAPNVTLGAYRVFGCGGSTSADIMIAAMERAYTDGMQVVNMSIGSARQWPQYPTALAADRLVNRGVVVVASIGNSGGEGMYAAGAPGVGKKVIGVANWQNTHVDQTYFTVSSDDMKVGFFRANSPAPPTSGTVSLARTSAAPTTVANDACSSLTPGSLTGKIALIRRGTCGFYNKAINAQNAGAIGVVIFNHVAGLIAPNVSIPLGSPPGSPAVTIPVVGIQAADGVTISNRIGAGATTLTWTALSQTFTNSRGGTADDSSSLGMTANLDIKPDITGPGGFIYAPYPLELGGYATLSGTSMSSPHVAGAVALLLEGRQPGSGRPAITLTDVVNDRVRAILQNSADARFWWNVPGGPALDVVHRQGAGMLDIDDAVLATTLIEPSKLPLGEVAAAASVIKTLTLTNLGATDVTYNVTHAAAKATTYNPGVGLTTFTAASTATLYVDANNTASFSTPSVLVPAGGSATVNVTITAPTTATLPDRGIFGGYIVFTPVGGGQSYSVPYAGFKGDYQSIPVLTPVFSAPNQLPWLAKRTPTSYSNNNLAMTAYTMATNASPFLDDRPYIVLHLDHQPRRFRIEVLNAATGASLGRSTDDEFYPRNDISTRIFAFLWDGTVSKPRYAVMPNGTYKVKVSVLKANGSSTNPAHWESWTSPNIIIARP